MKNYLCFATLYLISLVDAETTVDPTPVTYLTDDVPSVTWSPKSDETIIFQAALGYKIGVNITACDLKGSDGDYVTIKSGKEDDRGLLFTYTVSTRPSYLFNSDEVIAQYSGVFPNNTFTAIFSRFGQELTTVSTDFPTTTIILPTPGVNDSHDLSVYLYGKQLDDYRDQKLFSSLTNAIAQMAAEYCSDNSFPLNGSITTSNVIIENMGQCPMSWENYQKCVNILFAVPINLIEDSDAKWGGYQLTSEHLKIMWDRLASKYFTEIGLTLYPVPNVNSIVSWRIAILCIVLVIFVIFLLILRYVGIRYSAARKRQLSDTASIVQSNRNSQISLPPHYLQETPPLFESAYPMYNPEKGPASYSDPTYSGYADYEDLPQGEPTQVEQRIKINDNHIEQETGTRE